MDSSDDKAYELLAKALRTMSNAEQGVVLRALGLPQRGQVARHAHVAGKPFDAATALAMLREPSPDEKVGFLLRMPLGIHTSLKEWADANGHSMSVVVRVLIERFLAEQAPRSGA